MAGPRRGTTLPVLVGAVGLAALGTAQLVPIRHRIESDLTTRSLATLRQAGLTDVRVRFTGRDGVLTGAVDSQANADWAAAIVRDLDGVRVVDVRLAVTETTGPATSIPEATTAPPATSTPTSASTTTAPPATSTAPAASTPEASTPAAGAPATGTPDAGTVQAQLSGLPQVTFVTGSATLTPSGRAVLRRAAAVLATAPGLHLQVRGYTDDLGDWDVNLELSRARAISARATLIAYGVSADSVGVLGLSEQFPKVPNDSPAHRAMNRRVELAVTG